MSDERVKELEEEVEILKMEKEELKMKIERMGSGKGRKVEVLEILRDGDYSVKDISKKLGITCKNVSSQLSYLRGDGYEIWTDGRGRKKLIESNVDIEEV